MKKGLFAMFVLLTGHLLQAQTYPESSISPSLKTDADAVVRYQKTEFIQTDMNNASYRYTVVNPSFTHKIIFQKKRACFGSFQDNN